MPDTELGWEACHGDETESEDESCERDCSSCASFRWRYDAALGGSDARRGNARTYGRNRLLTPPRVAPNRGRASARTLENSYVFRVQGFTGTSLAMAHMKAMISRAIAVTATFECLPRAVSLLNRLQSRS